MRFYFILKIALNTILWLITNDLMAQIVETDSVYLTKSLGFSQGIIANGFVFTSGQVGWDANYKLVGDGGFENQANQCFKNIDLILSKANSGMEKLVHLRFFVTDISDENKKIIGGLMRKYFPNNYQPTTTLICVKALARKELMIEIEAVATINRL